MHLFAETFFKIIRNKKSKLGGGGSFPAFRPRFAGKCDPQSRDLTQLPSGYNYVV